MIRYRTHLFWFILAFIFTAALAACAPGQVSQPPNFDDLQGGVLATFEVNGQNFRVWTTNPDTITQLEALEAGDSAASIPNGKILTGPGLGNHNAPWNWHLDPQDIEMAEITVEVCDGEPVYVDDHVDEFVNTVGRYCPWSARLVSLEDYR